MSSSSGKAKADAVWSEQCLFCSDSATASPPALLAIASSTTRLDGWKVLYPVTLDCSGTEIAEAALVLPLVFMLLLGIIWFGRAFNIYSTLSHAAREGARVAAVPTCATCVPFGTPCYWSSSTFPCDRTIDETVTDALKASRVDPTQIFAYTPNPSPVACPGLDPAAACSVTSNKITICRGMRINSAVSNLPECGTIVSFAYPYQFYFPFTSLNHQRIGLHAAAEMRMEY